MPERATITQGVQVGVETVEGTEVNANKRLNALSMTLVPEYEFNTFSASGNKGTSVVAMNRKWTSVPVDGVGTYTEIVYPLSMIVDAATITTPGGGTNTRNWSFEIDATGTDAPKSLTVETGDANVAELATGVYLNDLTINFDLENGVTLDGGGIGRAMQTGITLTATPTSIPLVPILGPHISVYYDPIVGDEANQAAVEALLGTTKLTRVNSASVSIGGRFSQVWALDAAQDSYVAKVELRPTLTVELDVQADATGMGFLAAAESAEVGMLRIQAVGDEAETGVDYSFTFDAAVAVSDIGDRGDNDGVLSIPLTFTMMYEPTWARIFRFDVINLLTAL